MGEECVRLPQSPAVWWRQGRRNAKMKFRSQAVRLHVMQSTLQLDLPLALRGVGGPSLQHVVGDRGSPPSRRCSETVQQPHAIGASAGSLPRAARRTAGRCPQRAELQKP